MIEKGSTDKSKIIVIAFVDNLTVTGQADDDEELRKDMNKG